MSGGEDKIEVKQGPSIDSRCSTHKLLYGDEVEIISKASRANVVNASRGAINIATTEAQDGNGLWRLFIDFGIG
jgi:hypothetical protein